MILKLCGMKNADQIRQAEQIGIHWIGFIFYPKSPRFVDKVPDYLPQKAKRVGVFVNETRTKILETVQLFHLDFVQLHGNESPEFCAELRKNGLKIIKAFSIDNEFPSNEVKQYEGLCDYFLFDTKITSSSPKGMVYGGTGAKFQWEILTDYQGETPFLLSGGISSEDVEMVKSFSHKKCVGIDLNSRFETSPAQKNILLLHSFIKKIKNMNRINQLFQQKEKNILSVYSTAGYPQLNDTVSVIESLERHGIDLIEIGIPYSDPMADGAVIQASSLQALQNGMKIRVLFEQLAEIRQTVSIPLVLMGYLNPILHFGFERFCERAAACGIDGLIIPDLPFAEYEKSLKPIAEKYDLQFIMLITPETAEERIKEIDNHTSGFIYMVSSASVTGAKSGFGEENLAYFSRINAMPLKNPRLIGFGISSKSTFDAACENASGAIIGSKFVSLLGSEASVDGAVEELIRCIRG